MTNEATQDPAPGSLEKPIKITGEDVERLRAGEQVGALALPGTAERVYVTTEQPLAVVDGDGSPTGETYDTWGVTTDPNDYGTRVDVMGRYAHDESGALNPVGAQMAPETTQAPPSVQ